MSQSIPVQATVQHELAFALGQIENNPPPDDTLFGGRLCRVFLYYELFSQWNDPAYLRKGEQELDLLMQNLDAQIALIQGASFSSGAAGLCYVLNWLSKKGFADLQTHQSLAEIEKYLFDTGTEQFGNHLTDCLHGAFGIVHYFSHCRPERQTSYYLDQLLGYARQSVVQSGYGYWFRNEVPAYNGRHEINFSLSHGLAGMLLIILEARPHLTNKAMADDLLLRGIRFIRKHQLYADYSAEEYSYFPLSISENATAIENRPRLAWCYGDLNQALLFYRAGKLFNNPELIQLADIVGLNAVMRKDLSATQVADPFFCHGSAGLAAFFNTLFEESGHIAYEQASQFWIGQTVDQLYTIRTTKSQPVKTCSLLEGYEGIILTLSTFLSQSKSDWSSMLLL